MSFTCHFGKKGHVFILWSLYQETKQTKSLNTKSNGLDQTPKAAVGVSRRSTGTSCPSSRGALAAQRRLLAALGEAESAGNAAISTLSLLVDAGSGLWALCWKRLRLRPPSHVLTPQTHRRQTAGRSKKPPLGKGLFALVS